MRSVIRLATAIVLIIMAMAMAAAGAWAGEGVWFPLEVGWEWIYDIGGLESTRLSNVDQTWWEGHWVTVLRIEELDDEYEYFISGGERSGFYLHGGHIEMIIQDELVIATLIFDPPVPYIDPPLYVGKEWTAEGIVTLVVNDVTEEDVYLLEQSVVSHEDVLVPAGTFECFGFFPNFEYYAPASEPELDPARRVLDSLLSRFGNRGEAIEWFSDGYGLIQSGTGEYAMRLSSWTSPTPVAVSSWSALKALF